jgi:hypothetical protein
MTKKYKNKVRHGLRWLLLDIYKQQPTKIRRCNGGGKGDEIQLGGSVGEVQFFLL